MLKVGDQVEGQWGDRATVTAELGSGTQGTVFKARYSAGSKDVAVKWYFPPQSPASRQTYEGLRAGISELVPRQAPSRHFLWPIDLVSRDNEFGYVMDLRPAAFTGIPALLKRRVRPGFRVLIEAARQTVDAFKALQSEGLFYCDISDKNLFFDPSNGDILICDNDNVGSATRIAAVLGTQRFMAPEIVRGEQRPSATTDAFSMAVLLFLLLFNDHPLDGIAETKIHSFDPVAMKHLYGTNPVFIYDPNDESNRPDPAFHQNALIFWSIYPQSLRDIFIKAFTIGIHHPDKRPAFYEWERALNQLRDSVFRCPKCLKDNFWDPTAHGRTCWKCKRVLSPPLRLLIDDKRILVLEHDTTLSAERLASGAGSAMVCAVNKHPEQELLGLKNLSTEPWYMRTGAGATLSVPPGKTVPLVSHTSIRIGHVDCVVLAG
jgi:eukaryotic-like serine/threonine-protein kinase